MVLSAKCYAGSFGSAAPFRSAAVDGDPNPDANDANQVYVSGNRILELVAEAHHEAYPVARATDELLSVRTLKTQPELHR